MTSKSLNLYADLKKKNNFKFTICLLTSCMDHVPHDILQESKLIIENNYGERVTYSTRLFEIGFQIGCNFNSKATESNGLYSGGPTG